MKRMLSIITPLLLAAVLGASTTAYAAQKETREKKNPEKTPRS